MSQPDSDPKLRPFEAQHFDLVKFNVDKGNDIWNEYFKVKPKSTSIATLTNDENKSRYGKITIKLGNVYAVHKHCGLLMSRNNARLSNHHSHCDDSPTSTKSIYDSLGKLTNKLSNGTNIDSGKNYKNESDSDTYQSVLSKLSNYSIFIYFFFD